MQMSSEITKKLKGTIIKVIINTKLKKQLRRYPRTCKHIHSSKKAIRHRGMSECTTPGIVNQKSVELISAHAKTLENSGVINVQFHLPTSLTICIIDQKANLFYFQYELNL
ncbi:putative DNA polymerase [Trichinella spiralis]|uniref:putative DNA polymerase n=1 Tax=Trichinella spiralis TaxID=6334 RepID=UPI0001EFD80F|nr:putative DNA polymerase [Trichinella spiralis]